MVRPHGVSIEDERIGDVIGKDCPSGAEKKQGAWVCWPPLQTRDLDRA